MYDNKAQMDIDNFNNLCGLAQEIIWEGFSSKNKSILDFISRIGIVLSQASPIEQILFYSIVFMNEEYSFNISLCWQKEIICNNNRYKPDFYIDKVSPLGDGEYYELKQKIIVECDGFDYHSNKEQMNYDYEREINIKMEGYDVIRFTGSQIYKNPLGCAEMIFDYLQTKIKNEEYLQYKVVE